MKRDSCSIESDSNKDQRRIDERLIYDRLEFDGRCETGTGNSDVCRLFKLVLFCFRLNLCEYMLYVLRAMIGLINVQIEYK